MNEHKYDAAVEQLTNLVRGAWDYVGMEHYLKSSKQFALDHPIMTLFILVTTAMCSIPIFCFIAFVFGSMVLAFAGFIFLESTVLTIASVVLGGILFVVSLFSVGFSAFIVLAFYLVTLGHTMVQKAVHRYQQMVDPESESVSSSTDNTDGGATIHDGNGSTKT